MQARSISELEVNRFPQPPGLPVDREGVYTERSVRRVSDSEWMMLSELLRNDWGTARACKGKGRGRKRERKTTSGLGPTMFL
jgi:hypothetical protein